MFERVGGRDGAECFDGHIAERAAAGGERDAAHARVRVALEALENSVVLAVDGQNFRAAGRRGGEDVLAGEDEDFLRREREVFAGLERGEGRFETGGADDSDEDDVGAGQLREFDEAGEAADETSVGGKGRGMRSRGGESGVIKNADVAHAVSAGDGGEFFPVAAGGDGDELEFVGVRGDDAQGVFTDGAGGAEEDDAFARRKGGCGHGWRRARLGQAEQEIGDGRRE